MKKRTLGNTGIEVTELGLGTWALGGLGQHADAKNYGEVEERDAIDTFAAYVNAGGNHIDSAYNYHDCERRVGIYLKKAGNRDKLVLASKIWQDDPASIRKFFDTSRKLMGTDVIDILYLHNPPDAPDEMNRVLDIYQAMKDRGEIRAIGATIKGHNVTPETVSLMRQYIDSGRCNVIMCIFSVLRQLTGGAFAYAGEKGVGIVLRTVLESGFLTGKYRPGHRFTDAQDHRARWSDRKRDAVLQICGDFSGFARDNGYASPSDLATRFALDTPHVSSVLVGAKNVRQLQQNLSALDVPGISAGLRAEVTGQFGGKERVVSLDLEF